MGPGSIVVTGAAGGIGAACVEAFRGEGLPLILSDVSADALDGVVRGLADSGVRAEGHAGDLADPAHAAELARAAQAGGGLAALAHSAGLSGGLVDDARRILEVNLVATARLLEALRPAAGKGSAAVCVASQSGYMVARGMGEAVAGVLDAPLACDFHARLVEVAGPVATGAAGAYALSKWGVQRLVVAEAPRWGERGARIVSVSPGITDTSMGRVERDSHPDAIGQILAKTPVGGRMGRPEEIAAVVAFLCSDAASFVSGTDLLVDGGSTRQLIGS